MTRNELKIKIQKKCLLNYTYFIKGYYINSHTEYISYWLNKFMEKHKYKQISFLEIGEKNDTKLSNW